MIFQFFSLVLALAPLTATAFAPTVLPNFPAPAYSPSSRLVSNWRLQSAFRLALSQDSLAALLQDEPVEFKPRCIKMNNYWCIKHSNWTGEIAYDQEGHVAFSSAQDGALAAAVLLRRYYVDFHLTSAKAIISRWAPPDCGLGQISAPVAKALAPRGLRNTLRARFLASKRGGKHKLTASRVKSIIIPTLRAPSIMAGGGESSTSTKLASLDLTRGLSGAVLILPRLSGGSCPSENARLDAYIRAAAAEIPTGKDGDLGLFDPQGLPAANLARFMANMSAVEIGPYRPQQALIETALAQLSVLIAQKPALPQMPASH